MCLILAAYKSHPEYPLIILANRDEFHARPSQQAHWWENPEILAGKDLKAGGTWLGLNNSKKFGALTNYREPQGFRADAKSRGSLLVDFLSHEGDVKSYRERQLIESHLYNDFNLLLFESDELYYFGSKTQQLTSVEPGVYGLSNHLLNSPWPKVNKGKQALHSLAMQDEFNIDAAFTILADDQVAGDESLPETGVGLDKERLLSPLHINYPGYGTVSSNVILFHKSGRVDFYEKGHLNGGEVVFSW